MTSIFWHGSGYTNDSHTNVAAALKTLGGEGLKKYPNIHIYRCNYTYPTMLRDYFPAEVVTPDQILAARRAVWEASTIYHYVNFNKEDLIVLLGSSYYARKTTREWALTLIGVPQDQDRVKEHQYAATSGKMLKVPDELPAGWILVKDDADRAIGMYHKEANIISIALDIDVGSANGNLELQRTLILTLYRLIGKALGIWEEKAVLDYEKKQQERLEAERIKQMDNAIKYVYDNIFKKESKTAVFEKQIKRITTDIDEYENQLIVWKRELRKLTEEYNIAKVFDGVGSFTQDKLKANIEKISKLDYIERIVPYMQNGVAKGLEIWFKDSHLEVVSATEGHENARYFGIDTWNLPKGKYYMGTYTVELQPNDYDGMTMRVRTRKGHIHPHIDSTNGACTGTVMKKVLSDVSDNGDLTLLAHTLRSYLSQMNEGHSKITLDELASECGWDQTQMEIDLKAPDGSTYASKSEATPYAAIKSDLDGDAVYNSVPAYSVLQHARGLYYPERCKRYMRVLSEGGQPDTFVVLCGCGTKLPIGLTMVEDFITGKEAWERLAADKKKE